MIMLNNDNNEGSLKLSMPSHGECRCWRTVVTDGWSGAPPRPRKVGLLGAGGFGAVELWEHKATNETYAAGCHARG